MSGWVLVVGLFGLGVLYTFVIGWRCKSNIHICIIYMETNCNHRGSMDGDEVADDVGHIIMGFCFIRDVVQWWWCGFDGG